MHHQQEFRVFDSKEEPGYYNATGSGDNWGLLQLCAIVGLLDLHQQDLSEWQESWLPSGKVKPILSPALTKASSNKMLQSLQYYDGIIVLQTEQIKTNNFF